MGEKRVLTLLLGSPRAGGNTEALADALARGAAENGWEARKVRLAGMKLNGCVDCRKCWSKGAPCIQNDDMDKVYHDIKEAAAVAFVSPVYFYSWTTQIKPVWDRFLPFGMPSPGYSLKGKKTILLAAAGDSEEDCFQGVIESFSRSTPWLGWDTAGMILAAGIYGRGEMESKGAEYLKKAEELGRGL